MNQSVAIVTGASQGIGRSTSIRLARDFSGVVLAARNAAALAEVAAAVKSVGAEPLICEVDLKSPEASETLSRVALNRDGGKPLASILLVAPALDQRRSFGERE